MSAIGQVLSVVMHNPGANNLKCSFHHCSNFVNWMVVTGSINREGEVMSHENEFSDPGVYECDAYCEQHFKQRVAEGEAGG